MMDIVNYKVTFEIPEQLRKDIYIVSSADFLTKFNNLFGLYEQLDLTAGFKTTIEETETQIIP